VTLSTESSHECIIILGGSFDPVHKAHVALAQVFLDLFKPAQLRLIPTGKSAQKIVCQASPEHRVAMLKLAFAELANTVPVFIDTQEIERAEKGQLSYSVDTLTQLRTEFGPTTPLIFLVGADQLQQLHRWKDWEQLFTLAHIAAVTRPGFLLHTMDKHVADEFIQRAGKITELKSQPSGRTFLHTGLSIDVSSTQIRNALHLSNDLQLVPHNVLNYIQQHHLYH
jgi:nicotinate-nucleotide adenylyltransferase